MNGFWKSRNPRIGAATNASAHRCSVRCRRRFACFARCSDVTPVDVDSTVVALTRLITTMSPSGLPVTGCGLPSKSAVYSQCVFWSVGLTAVAIPIYWLMRALKRSTPAAAAIPGAPPESAA